MKRKFLPVLFVLALSLVLAVPAFARGEGNPHGTAEIYVTSQGLVYESIVLGDLPMHGRFQKLEMGGPTGLQTEFGPGDQGYVGGRWWIDLNEDGEMNEGDAFFLCPLLGPGYEHEG